MNATLRHRGPDDEGIYRNGNVGLAMRRLSIIDVAGGHQPICNEDETKWIVFNGEIYNHQGLRKELESRGHSFRTKTDTEAILHLYEEKKEDCVKDLNGMFAFAIWDERERSLFLARDRLGIKPLYYYHGNDPFIFGSEIKAISAAGVGQPELDFEALYHYLTYLYIPAPHTIYKNVRKLEPGHHLRLKDGKLEIKKYWTLRYHVVERFTEKSCLERLEALLADAVQIRLMSEVPLGAFLSGGIDSSTIVHFMHRLGEQKVKTFSIGFPAGEPHNELDHARKAARHLGTDHHEMIVEPHAVKILPEVIGFLDEPMADSSVIPTYLLSKFTREWVTVALAGDGGDELFAGYERYLAIQAVLKYEKVPLWIREALSKVIGLTGETEQKEGSRARLRRALGDLDRGYEETFLRWITNFNGSLMERLCTPELKAHMVDIRPHDLARSYLNSRFEGDVPHPLNRMLHFETKAYLPDDLLVKVDRMSMAHSLEVRVPFLDHRVVEFVATIPPSFKIKGFMTKYILKRLMSKYLPEDIVYRRKQGFVPPLKDWLRNELRELVKDALLDRRARERGFFLPHRIEQLLNDHQNGKREFHFQIWVLLTLELWCRQYLD